MFKVDDLVTVIVDHPSGVESADVKGEVGIVTEINEFPEEKTYLIHTLTDAHDYGWCFGEDEIRLANNKEIKEKLQYELRKYHAI